MKNRLKYRATALFNKKVKKHTHNTEVLMIKMNLRNIDINWFHKPIKVTYTTCPQKFCLTIRNWEYNKLATNTPEYKEETNFEVIINKIYLLSINSLFKVLV
jgi:hypothetical protein